ncbi:MAG: class I SAM-dependent methyltransferase [Bdellovibrionales bacterium]|nr:class I SAM-dependent methyltransferase [Bdellovibrionales bacterium]
MILLLLALISFTCALCFFIWEKSQLFDRSFLEQLVIEYYRSKYRLQDFLRDQKNNIFSTSRVKVQNLSAPQFIKKHARAYEPTPYAVLDRIFDKLSFFDKTELAFIDYGCGRGRTLNVAKAYGFKNLQGLDIDAHLLQSCQNNLARNGITNFEAQLFHISADDYLPPEGDKIIYMYNPFDEEMLRSALNNIKQTQGEAFLIYVNPVNQRIFKEYGAELVRHYDHPYEDYSFSFFRMKNDSWVKI